MTGGWSNGDHQVDGGAGWNGEEEDEGWADGDRTEGGPIHAAGQEKA